MPSVELELDLYEPGSSVRLFAFAEWHAGAARDHITVERVSDAHGAQLIIVLALMRVRSKNNSTGFRTLPYQSFVELVGDRGQFYFHMNHRLHHIIALP